LKKKPLLFVNVVFIWGYLSVFFLSIPLQCQAATLTELDSIEQIRTQEQEQRLRQKLEVKPDVRLRLSGQLDQGLLPEHESPCFSIDKIVLEDISGVNPSHSSADKFQWALNASNELADGTPDIALGRCLGSSGINILVKRVQNAIVNKGFITTRIVVTPQDLTTGTLKLTLVPGRIHKISFLDADNIRATYWNAVPAKVGDLLNLRDIEQALENFKRLPTAEADIKIQPSSTENSQPGDSDLVFDWKQGFPFRLNLSLDDSGSPATGKYQGNLTLSYDHWWTLNDLFYVSFNHDLGGGDIGRRGTKGYTIHYSIPFGYWLLAATGSNNQYHQTVAGFTQNYIYSGDSANQEIKLSRMIYRDAYRKTSLSIRGWLRSSQNYIDDTEVIVQRRRMAGWDFGISHQQFIAKGSLSIEVNYRRGVKGYGSLPAPEEAFEEGTSQPEILTSQVQLSIPFQVENHTLNYHGILKGQLNYTPLVPLDRFSIGSRYTVRGFDGNQQLSAERGWLFRNELSLALSHTGQALYLGVDSGEVSGPTSTKLVGTTLSGGVIGLRGGYKAFIYDLFFGKPISKPSKFIVSDSVIGFSVNASF